MSDELRLRSTDRTRPAPAGAGAAAGGGTDRAALRERAERLRNLGSGIIRDALSGDSERFLEHSRQQGGQ
jgi:hypothetical protein